MKSYVTVTDQFCGASGSSLGAVHAGCEVVLAMNHWELAIEMAIEMVDGGADAMVLSFLGG